MKFEIIFIDQITKNLQLNYDVRIKIYFETLNKYTKKHTHFLFLFHLYNLIAKSIINITVNKSFHNYSFHLSLQYNIKVAIYS